MIRIGRLVSSLRGKKSAVSTDELARAAWESAIGKRLYARVGEFRMYGTKAVVEVEDNVWKSQMTSLAPQILQKMQAMIGPHLVQQLTFEVGVVRPAPVTDVPLPGDEADGIRDPNFRQIYRASRVRSEQLAKAREEKAEQLRQLARMEEEWAAAKVGRRQVGSQRERSGGGERVGVEGVKLA